MEVPSNRPLCPNEGSFSLDSQICQNTFIKCERPNTPTRTMRARMFQCEEGYKYWSISRKCERFSRALGCGENSDYTPKWEIPIETINV